MPIKIKITSKGADISEYGSTESTQSASDNTDSEIKSTHSSNIFTDSNDKSVLNDSTSKESELEIKPKEISSSGSNAEPAVADAMDTSDKDPSAANPQINYEYEGEDTFYTDAQTQGNC